MFHLNIVILMTIFNAGPGLATLMRLAETRQATALRPGTRSNHKSALSAFVEFLARHSIDFLDPSDEIICAYFELCIKRVKSPATVRNYASSLSSAYSRMGLDNSVFSSPKVRSALKSIDTNVRYVPTPSRPVTPRILMKVLRVVSNIPEGYNLVAAYTLMFHSFCRISNFAAPTSDAFDASRQFTRSDVVMKRDGITLRHKWSKSHQLASHSAILNMAEIPGSPLCPKSAYMSMVKRNPNRYTDQPLLCFEDGNHIPSTYIRKVWNVVMASIGIPHPESYTLHGIRRGAASFVFQNDPSAKEDIKNHGLWRSSVVDKYLLQAPSKVLAVMRNAL